jgi:lipopolysaccharide transport system ATP-binding protein
MTQPIIEIKGLGKKYRIGAHKEPYLSLRDSIAKPFRRLLPYNQGPRTKDQGQSSTDFWALRDVSFTVNQGEAVGIIGRNGAGKSTLLKILSQITPPTEGEIIMHGRVASLLEVGTGFHPELTGRENIFLNGAILGMTRAEIRRKFDEIVAFAEIDKFLDTPVKRYSSGMYVRLAFAVAAHLDPEILVVDEVLAVGDAEFQKKCLGKMSDVAKSGRTVLFVSHNMAAIDALCSRAVMLYQGGVKHIGETKTVLQAYSTLSESLTKVPLSDRSDREGDGCIRLTSIDIFKPVGLGVQPIATGSDAIFRFNYKVNQPVARPMFLFSIFNNLGTNLGHMTTGTAGTLARLAPGHGSIECKLPRLPFPAGRYRMTVVVRCDHDLADRVEGAAVFDVQEGRFYEGSNETWRGWGSLLVDHVWDAGSRTAHSVELPVHAPVAESLEGDAL